ncbi:O-methyltransferase [Halalkalicoccus jeotgali]|uniref:O-methyltransferase family 3 n=1 Tax=Halalkalicoccus jeotgali (strain DSM 18796 / CECT 7217 / JCM 14584 / KCTC 4019 / B3) TaxID=795797 RepID=D8J413_HALJB|nr:O-methyltransferase [Halalkalicoccus jeotgali]ADJ15405.1 O-methyltransferase family 3 [Halalkalicoccus jeotgali B3]ELY35819.1 O-methyltransferase family 3 [Halalkalicoccus jeotgali B3]
MAHLADDVLRFVRAAGPQPDDVLEEMDAYAEDEGFPHVGPEVGGFLRLTARLAGARSVFEFGSGYGYSAYWFAKALPEDGEVVLTEVDEGELEMAREYLARGGYDDLASYEHGDAMDTIERYDGPFDVVLIDHQKHRYSDALEAVREKLAPGAVVIADNAMSADGAVVFDDLLAHLEGRSAETNEGTRGIADYLDTVRSDPAFETMVLPLGEGIAVSHFADDDRK